MVVTTVVMRGMKARAAIDVIPPPGAFGARRMGVFLAELQGVCGCVLVCVWRVTLFVLNSSSVILFLFLKYNLFKMCFF